MSFEYKVLKRALNKLHATENEMHQFYSELLKEVGNPEIKKKIKFIRNQEKTHILMVTQVISILGLSYK